MDGAKNNWNKEHDILIKGYKLKFIQDVTETASMFLSFEE
jgi:hypothetical protein